MKEAMFWHPERNGIRCDLCLRKCFLTEGKKGYCGIRVVKSKKLYNIHFSKILKPEIINIEKSHIFHFLPDTKTVLIQSKGNNLPKPVFSEPIDEKKLVEYEPEKIIELAKKNGVKSIVYSFEEPMMYVETVYRIAKLAYREGLKNVLITNAFVETDVIKNLSKYFNGVLINVFASLNEKIYSDDLEILDVEKLKKSIVYFRKQRFFIEIANHVAFYEGYKEDHKAFAEWIVENLGASIPYHLINLRDMDIFEGKYYPLVPTDLISLYDDAHFAGLRYVYVDDLEEYQSTHCYNCKTPVIEREGLKVIKMNVIGGRCPNCRSKIELVE